MGQKHPSIVLKGPIEVDINESALQPTHDFDEDISASATHRFKNESPFHDLVSKLYIDQISERITVVLVENTSTRNKHAIINDIMSISSFVFRDCISIFAWPSEKSNNAASTLDILGFHEHGNEFKRSLSHFRQLASSYGLHDGNVTAIIGDLIPVGTGKAMDRLRTISGQRQGDATIEESVGYFDTAIAMWFSDNEGDTRREAETIYDAIDVIIGSMEMAVYEIDMNDKGSWFKKMRMTSIAAVGAAAFKGKTDLLEKVIEDVALLKSEVGVNASYLKMTEKMMKYVEKNKKAAVRIGTVLIVKYESKEDGLCLVARRLDDDEAKFLDANPSAMKEPEFILDRLARHSIRAQIAPCNLKTGDLREVSNTLTFEYGAVSDDTTDAEGNENDDADPPSPSKRLH